PSLDLGLLGEPSASLWPKWLSARAGMTPRERARPDVPDSEADVRRVARELARKALVQDPPDRDAFHSAWGDAEQLVEAEKEKSKEQAKRRKAAEREKSKGESWVNSRSRNKIGS
ncbi:MAG: hypothetical protein WD101_04110, partial [Gemmatimonadota bacterium]